eukprot:CAMPEP_0197946056 /NCGR_PEP_ID=MMETSP1439-20131203/126217_1 /TAXON_ID=66791 /ORGANISM="Gonyaulax spinifera, Strain CCMP409" /LENGTH=237 /DNA_ID=CAMNT_0043569311 /DNA_START=66 /DNA_END=776 /DNA_ORIENTATION=-
MAKFVFALLGSTRALGLGLDDGCALPQSGVRTHVPRAHDVKDTFKGPLEALGQAAEALDPFLVASNVAVARLPTEPGTKVSDLWGKDVVKDVGGIGVSNGIPQSGVRTHVPRAHDVKDTFKGPLEALGQAAEALDPFLVASNVAVARLPTEPGTKVSDLWGKDVVKDVGGIGVSNGKFKAGVAVAGGVGDETLHALGSIGYMGAEKEGVKPSDWRSLTAEAAPGKVQIVGSAPAADG